MVTLIGRKQTKEHIKNRGEALSKYYKENGSPLKGRPISQAKKDAISRKNKGHSVSEETRDKIRKVHLGRKHSEETKKKMSLAHVGKNTWAKGKKHTIEQRKAKSERQKGEKSYLWKGGKTKVNKEIRGSFEYKLWRTSVFERDNYTCIWCGSRSGKGEKVILNADHIKPFCDYPELRLAIDNGRTLCLPCHKTTDTYAGKGLTRKR